jgi:hypothetical protein
MGFNSGFKGLTALSSNSSDGSLVIVKPLNAELNSICHLLALLGAHHNLHVSRLRVKQVHRTEQSRQVLIRWFSARPEECLSNNSS